MIVLHGKGDSLKPFREFDKEMGLKGMNYLLLNAPKKYLTGFSWYGDPPFQRAGVLKIRQKIFLLLQDLENEGWDLKNIYLLGFSQGCLVSTDVALHCSKKLGGVIGISGYFQFYPRWRNSISKVAKKTPWILTHGRRDDVLPIEDTRYGVKKLKGAGLKIDWVESDKKHVFEDADYPVIKRWLQSRLNL